MRRIDYIVIHCSATPEGRDVSMETIRGWHTGKGWSDIGYHYVIELNGAVRDGRPLERAGAHVAGWNAHSIGVCYVGGVDADMQPKDTRTNAQRLAMTKLVQKLHERFPDAEILGHRDFPNVAKACPSFPAKDWWAGKY